MSHTRDSRHGKGAMQYTSNTTLLEVVRIMVLRKKKADKTELLLQYSMQVGEAQIGMTDMCEDSENYNDKASTAGKLNAPPRRNQISLTSSMASNSSTYTLKQHGDLRSDADELLVPEVVFWVAKKLDERHQRAPWVRTMDNETLKENFRYHFAESVIADLDEEVKDQRAEPVGMCIGIAEVQNHAAEEVMLSCARI